MEVGIGTGMGMTLQTHPSLQSLSLYVDGELGERRAGRIGEHLESCARCRREVAFILEVQHGLRRLARPRPPSDLLAEVLERRATGERVILPTAGIRHAERTRPSVRGVAAAVAAMALGAVGIGLLTSGPAEAGSSRLTFTPDNLDLTSSKQVEYRTVGPLAGEPRVRLRGRYYTATDRISRGEGGSIVSAYLESNEPGIFGGAIELPGSAVYARFRVEDTAGEYLDPGAASTEILARYADGTPKFEALWQKGRIFENTNETEALEAVRRLTELYPERIEGWERLHYFEQAGLAREGSPEAHERMAAAHRERLRGFITAAAGRELTIGELAAIVAYARRLDETDLFDRFAEALQRRAPRHPIAVQHRVAAAVDLWENDPRARLSALEREWQLAPPTDIALPLAGLATAVAARDLEQVGLWAERLVLTEPGGERLAAATILSAPELAPAAAAQLRKGLERLDDHADRPIDLTVSEHEAQRLRVRHLLLRELGFLLHQTGQVEAAFDTLARAAATGWNADLFEQVAGLAESLGRRDDAVRFHALAAADPVSGDAYYGRWVERIEGLADRAHWYTRLDEAEERQRAEIYRGLLNIKPETSVLRRTDGTTVRLASMLGESATIVLLWSRYSTGSVALLESLAAERDRLSGLGVEVLAIARDPDPGQLREYVSALGVALPMFVEDRRDVAMTGRQMPGLTILDRTGTVIFRFSELPRAIRAVFTLARDAASH